MATNRQVERDYYYDDYYQNDYNYQHYVHPERQQLVHDYDYDYRYNYDQGGWNYPQNNLHFYSRSYRRNRGYREEQDAMRYDQDRLPEIRDQRQHFDEAYGQLRSVPNNNLSAADKKEMMRQLALQEVRELEYQNEEYEKQLALQSDREKQHESERYEERKNEELRARLNNLIDDDNVDEPPRKSRRKNNQRSVHETAADLR